MNIPSIEHSALQIERQSPYSTPQSDWSTQKFQIHNWQGASRNEESSRGARWWQLEYPFTVKLLFGTKCKQMYEKSLPDWQIRILTSSVRGSALLESSVRYDEVLSARTWQWSCVERLPACHGRVGVQRTSRLLCPTRELTSRQQEARW